MIIVTSYDSPDIDGIACSIAYAALLNSQGKQGSATYRGDLGLETEFVKKFTGVFPAEKHEGSYEDSDTRYVLVDVSDPSMINPAIKPEQVTEIYDHRKVVYPEKFPNAQAHIELVGSCATLITEQLQKIGMQPDRATAVYLYSAILSNTTNFQGPDTTQRDRDTANWLKSIAQVPDDYVQQMFTAKSIITADNIYTLLDQDLKTEIVNDKKIGIAQLEIANLEQTLASLESAFKDALKRIKEKERLDYLMFDGIDVIRGFSVFYTFDEISNEIFKKALGISDLKPQTPYRTKEIVLRKRILPKLKEGIGALI